MSPRLRGKSDRVEPIAQGTQWILLACGIFLLGSGLNALERSYRAGEWVIVLRKVAYGDGLAMFIIGVMMVASGCLVVSSVCNLQRTWGRRGKP